MAYKQLRDNLKTILDELSSTFVDIKTEPTFEFSGYPSLFISPSGNESDFQSTQDNMRVYDFKVFIFQEFSVTPLGTAYDILLTDVDLVINKIEEQESPDSDREMATGLAGYETLAAVLAVPGRFIPDEVEKLLAAEITVRCKVLVDFTQLT